MPRLHFSEPRGKTFTKIFTIPGDEQRLNKIQNEDLIDVIDERINYNAEAMIYQIYLKYIDFREEAEIC